MNPDEHFIKWYKDPLLGMAAIALIAASVAWYLEWRAPKKQQEIKVKNLEEVTEQLVKKVSSTLEAGDFIYSFDNHSEQEEWGNRYSKLIFDELKQAYPNSKEEQIYNSPDIRNLLMSIGEKVRLNVAKQFTKASLEIFHGLQHDYLVIGYPDPNMLTVTYNISDEAKNDIKRFEGFVKSACENLRYRFTNKKVPSKKLIGAIRDYMLMHSLDFYELEKEHSAIRQKTITDTIYQRIRKELEIPKPVPKNISSLARLEDVYCNRVTTKNWHIPLSAPLKRIVTPYVMRHKG